MNEGLNTAFEKMKECRLNSSEIMEVENYIKVIILHTSLAKPEEQIVEFLQGNEMITNESAIVLTENKSGGIVKKLFHKLREDGGFKESTGTKWKSFCLETKK